jgi:hypothetical protein
MRFHLLLTLVLALVPASACSGGGSSGTGGSTNTNPCAGLGCASGPGTLTLEVVDGAGQPVVGPQFTEQGHAVDGLCETDAGMVVIDAGACASWVFQTLSIGAHTITVSAPGYDPATVSASIQGPAGCCGQGPAVNQTVTLQHSPTDAGAG